MWSTLYWVVVGVSTLGFAFDVGEAWSHRENDRFYPEAVAVYVVAWALWASLGSLVVLLSRAIDPKKHFWAGAPTAIAAGAAIVFLGGHILAALWDLARHRDPGPKPVLERDSTPEELAAAEAYDDQWRAAYRAEHRLEPHFDDWQAEYLKRRASEQPERERHDEHDHERR